MAEVLSLKEAACYYPDYCATILVRRSVQHRHKPKSITRAERLAARVEPGAYEAAVEGNEQPMSPLNCWCEASRGGRSLTTAEDVLLQ